jgi:hypothetical protein
MFGVEEARPTILEMLQDTNNGIRASAAFAITCLDGAKAIPRLLPLLDDADFHLKHNTGPQLLQFLKAKEAIPKFQEWAQSPDVSLRGTGLWYLCAIGPDEAVPILLKGLSDPEPGMRASAVDQLGRMKYPQAPPLFRVLLRDAHAHVRRTAAAALVALGDRAGLPLVVSGPIHSPGRFELNLFRNPEVCKAWKTKILAGPLIVGSTREILEEVARRGGILLEAPPELTWPSWVNECEVQGRDLLSVISGLLWGTGGGVVEEGRLRILSLRQGHRFWTRWWAQEQLKSEKQEDQEEGRTLLAELDASEARLKAWTKERDATAIVPPKPEEVKAILTPGQKCSGTSPKPTLMRSTRGSRIATLRCLRPGRSWGH